MITAKQIIKAIGSQHLNLYRGNGYQYFIFDDKARNFHECHSEYTMRLNDYPLDCWVEIGKSFVDECEAKIKERTNV